MERALTASAESTPVGRPFGAMLTLPDDCRLAGAVRANVLIVYRTAISRPRLGSLLAAMYAPVVTWRPGDPLVLPRVAPTAAILFHDVGALPLDDQQRLVDWLDRAEGRTQIVSMTPAPLLSRVAAGAFDPTLYYRLNVFCVDLSA
jgi:sigma-54-interacting transcriptional regulator